MSGYLRITEYDKDGTASSEALLELTDDDWSFEYKPDEGLKDMHNITITTKVKPYMFSNNDMVEKRIQEIRGQ